MDADGLLRQAIITGEEYLNRASSIICAGTDFEDSFDNCIRLAELMAQDFDSMTRHSSMSRLCDSLDRIAEAMENMKDE